MPKYSNPKDFPPAAGHTYYDGPKYSQKSQSTLKPAPGRQSYTASPKYTNPVAPKGPSNNSGPSKAKGNSARIQGNPRMPYKK